MQEEKKKLNYKLQTESINDKIEFHASHVDILLIYVEKFNLKIELNLKFPCQKQRPRVYTETDCDLL